VTETQTETVVQAQTILARITVGAILQFQSVASPSSYAIAFNLEGKPLVMTGERVFGNPNFVVTMYSYDGRNQAKISLLSKAAPIGYWAPGQSFQGFPNPIVIDDKRQGQFLLTDTGRGISIENTFAPPPPFIRRVPPGIAPYLTYGYPDTGGNAGLFNISIVG
jgi:hypothetical protein